MPPRWRTILGATMRRTLFALAISVLLHVAAVGVAVGVGIWQTAVQIPRMTVQPIAVEVNDLPLGAPAPKALSTNEPTREATVRAPRKPKTRAPSAEHSAVAVEVPPDAGVPESRVDADTGTTYDGGGSIDGGHRRPGDLRRAGPEGSRLVALFRIDRLRASPESTTTIAAVDRLLLLLPDRRRLVEGSGLDLYRDFDSLLIATPNPADDAVTFLAARHHVDEAAFKTALDRSARTEKKSIQWQTIEGRPVGIRQQGTRDGFDRDDRLLVLPSRTLALIATPAYAGQLLGKDAQAKARAIDGGPPAAKRPNWPEIVERIQAEDDAIPDEAAFMMTASNLFGKADGELLVIPPTRGQSDDQPPRSVGSNDGEPPPQTLTLLVGVASPFLSIAAEFQKTADADRWERDLPAWKRKLATNPIVLLAGFSPLVSRAEFSRDDDVLKTRIELTTAELQRLLTVVANVTQSMLAGKKPN